MAKEVTQWITIKGKHVPIFEGESQQDAYNRVVAKDNEDLKEKQIAKRRAEVAKLNPDSKEAKDEAYAKKAWEYFKDLKPEVLDEFEKEMADNPIALKQIQRAKRRQTVLAYYSKIPSSTVNVYAREVARLPEGDEKTWAMEGLERNKAYKYKKNNK